MRKRIFVTLVMIGCMALMGCGAGLSFDVLAGYKQFFTQNFGLRYYANFTYASFTTYERSGETNAMNELWCEY